MVFYDLICHGQSCSNVYIAQDAAGSFSGGPYDNPNCAPEGTKGIPGDHFFRSVLTPYGVGQCIAERRRLESLEPAYANNKVRGILSSPLERAVQTAILTTPFCVLRACSWTIRVVPCLQEAVKYQCDLASNEALLQQQVDLTKEMYVKILQEEGRFSESGILRSVRLQLDWTPMIYESQHPESVDGMRTCQRVTESVETLRQRAIEARWWLAQYARGASDDRYLVFTHRQFTSYLLGLPLCNPPQAKRIEIVLGVDGNPPRLVGDVCPVSRGTGEEADIDSEMRVEQGYDTYRVAEKVAWIEAMGRQPANDWRFSMCEPTTASPDENGRVFLTTSVPVENELLQEIANAAAHGALANDLTKFTKNLWWDWEYAEKMLQKTTAPVWKASN